MYVSEFGHFVFVKLYIYINEIAWWTCTYIVVNLGVHHGELVPFGKWTNSIPLYIQSCQLMHTLFCYEWVINLCTCFSEVGYMFLQIWFECKDALPLTYNTKPLKHSSNVIVFCKCRFNLICIHFKCTTHSI